MATTTYLKGSLPQSLRLKIFKRDDFRCFYCAAPCDLDGNMQFGASVDHLTPECRGGSHEESNLVTACRSCNCRKRQMTLEEYRLHITHRQLGYGVAADLFSEGLAALTHPVPFSDEILKAIEWLGSHMERITFPGEGQ